MIRWRHVLDSSSDEDIGWSRTLDLPRHRHVVRLEARRAAAKAAAAEQPGTSKASEPSKGILLIGPKRKRIKLEPEDVEDNETEEEKKLKIVNWPDKVLKNLISYLPVEDRIKIRCTCKKLRDLVDGERKLIAREIFIRRLDETELGLFLSDRDREIRFVIHNRDFTWTERSRLRTISEIVRGAIDWTRHHRNRMGRIRTACKAMFTHSYILRVNVYQVNLSNAFIRDLARIMKGVGAFTHCLDLQVQMYEERPDFSLLLAVPTESLAFAIRLRDREPPPQIERFLNKAMNKFNQVIIDVRHESWKFKSIHFRKSYEEYGINDAALMHYMTGEEMNFLRLKVVCKYVTREGILNTVLFLRARRKSQPSRGFCILVPRDTTDGLMSSLQQSLPQFGEIWDNSNEFFAERGFKYTAYNTSKEYMQVREIKQEEGKAPLSEVRYYRKGDDSDEEYLDKRCDDDRIADIFEQAKFVERVP